MFMKIYKRLDLIWQKTERVMTIAILSAMTLLTFIYTMLNNFYSFFYWLGDTFPVGEELFYNIGDMLLDGTYAMTWANAFSMACFAWLIFFCMSYGVRIGGHIGVDALIKKFNTPTQRLFAYIGLGVCLTYAAIMMVASIEWVHRFYELKTEAEDLYQLGILKWHITIMVPIGFGLMILRYLEIGYKIFTHQQDTLGLADEAKDAVEDVGLVEGGTK